jgi:hypothetical protein
MSDNLRIRFVCVALALGLGATVGVAYPLPLLLLPGPTDVIAAVDYLTKKDSAVEVRVKTGKVESRGKLLVGEVRADIHLQRSSRNWRGQVSSSLTVPSEIRYAIDLADLQVAAIRTDAQTGTLYVRLPPVRVETVTPLLPEVQKDVTYRGVRFRLLDAPVATELQHAMLLHDYQSVARQRGESQSALMRDVARARMRQLLEGLLLPAYPGLTVQVE